jgi:hypothetical protein
MGEIKTVISGEVTLRKIIGDVTIDEMLNALREYYAGQVTRNWVWDLSNGSVRSLTSNDMKLIAELVLQHAHSRAGGKTAIVAPNDLDYGISRMLNIYAELGNILFQTQTFRTLSEAAKWIGVDDLPDIDDVTGLQNAPDRP